MWRDPAIGKDLICVWKDGTDGIALNEPSRLFVLNEGL
jgi:hypothetical protein